VEKRQHKTGFKKYLHIFALPWCCVIPIGLAFLGFTGGALGTFLSKFTPYFLVLSILLISYANYTVWFVHGAKRSRIWVIVITIFAILAWLWSIIFVMRWI